MKNWRKIAEAINPDAREEELERIAPALDSLDAAFRPLAATLTREDDPAVVFRAAECGE